MEVLVTRGWMMEDWVYLNSSWKAHLQTHNRLMHFGRLFSGLLVCGNILLHATGQLGSGLQLLQMSRLWAKTRPLKLPRYLTENQGYIQALTVDHFLAHLCNLHGGLLCIAFCLSVVSTCYWLHSKKNSCQQTSKVLLPWQVGLIANVKLHFCKLLHYICTDLH